MTRTPKAATGKTSKAGGKAKATTDTPSIALPEALTIAQTEAFMEQLRGIGRDTQSLLLDAAPLQVIDAAGVQLLVAFNRYAQQQGLHLEWHHSAAVLAPALQLLGIPALPGFEQAN